MATTQWKITASAKKLQIEIQEGLSDKLIDILFRWYFPFLTLVMAVVFLYLDRSGLLVSVVPIPVYILLFGFGFSWAMVTRLNPVKITVAEGTLAVASRRLWLKPVQELIPAEELVSIVLETLRPSSRSPVVSTCSLRLKNGRLKKVASLKEGSGPESDSRDRLLPTARALSDACRIPLELPVK